MSKTSIVTYTGKEFDFLNPDPASICIEDIAHSLALTCRYRGHTRTHYSVAEHCVRASYLGVGDSLICLLHDAAEAYIGDQSSPQKRKMHFKETDSFYTFFSTKEKEILFTIGIALGISGLNLLVERPSVKQADRIMFATEVRDLMPDSDLWPQWADEVEANKQRIRPWPWEVAELEYLDRFKELISEQ